MAKCPYCGKRHRRASGALKCFNRAHLAHLYGICSKKGEDHDKTCCMLNMSKYMKSQFNH